jgi:hypothetical protein
MGILHRFGEIKDGTHSCLRNGAWVMLLGLGMVEIYLI